MRDIRVAGEVLLLFALAVALGAISNLVRPDSSRIAWIGKYDVPRSAPSASEGAASSSPGIHSAAPFKDPGALFLTIDAKPAHRLHTAGALFIDARRTNAYEAGHISGARNIAVWEHDVDSKVAQLTTDKLPYDIIMVIYCSGGACEDSEMLAAKIGGSGFYNLYIYHDGFPDWVTRGWPVRSGRTP